MEHKLFGKDLVSLNSNDEPVTTSLKVAKHFGKQHKDVLEKIRNLSAEISADLQIDGYNPKFTECTYIDSWNRPQVYFEMNRDAFVELVGNMNTAKAREWKRKYHAAFNKMQKALETLAIKRGIIRQSSIFSNKDLMAAVHDEVIPAARKNGSTTPDNVFYMNFNKLINRNAGVPAGQRDSLPTTQLIMIDQMQNIAAAKIRADSHRGKTHKEIYSGAKQVVEGYAQVALVAERFLLN